ncbi:MAG: 16S rRNA (cytidine(1402)-2'-O)-methyltransferase [Puniceicoccales bacterium]|jgi:16S rRNA (cytidine1402-2'-O)-methyltransferase|nr:16S rRNA (cytidine(1402)-2'-O)-methyltransferase [Puniceicoccales bacterium]
MEQAAHPLAPGLYVVATPIGNLGDITLRALKILKSVDLIACEDTRTTAKLLRHYDIVRAMVSYHEHNERARASEIADKIQNGSRVALVCDAGTPAVSDPGFRLVRECRIRRLLVVPIPGPSAFTTALCASGLPSNAFLFLGFLSNKSAARVRTLENYRNFPHTLILYESCHRAQKLLGEIVQVFGHERVIAIGRELTKLHETFYRGNAGELQKILDTSQCRGEFVFLIAPEDFSSNEVPVWAPNAT